MKAMSKLLLGVAGSVLVSSAAMAADLTPVMPAPVAPTPPPAPSFAWAGPYAGVFAGYDFGFALGEAGVQYGYNYSFGNFIAGIELETGHPFIPGFAVINASLNAHAGVVLADRAFLYVEAGIGEKFFTPLWNVGGGVEVAVTDTVSLFAEAKANFAILGGGGFFGWQLTGGTNYHPGGGMMAGGGGGFNGLYIGASAGYVTAPYGFGETGHQAGYNYGFGNFLVGLEVEPTHSFGMGPFANASLTARAGTVLANSFLVYGEAGIGSYITLPVWSVGGGVEYLLGNSGAGVFAEAAAQFAVGGGGYVGTEIQGGINYHFGN